MVDRFQSISEYVNEKTGRRFGSRLRGGREFEIVEDANEGGRGKRRSANDLKGAELDDSSLEAILLDSGRQCHIRCFCESDRFQTGPIIHAFAILKSVQELNNSTATYANCNLDNFGVPY